MHSNVHVRKISKVGSLVKSDFHLLYFLSLNWVQIFLFLLQVENESGMSVRSS